MKLIHLRRCDFDGSVQLSGICRSPSGTFFASGFIGPGPNFGNVLQFDVAGSQSRLGHGLTLSTAVAFDPASNTLVVVGNDGMTPNRRSAPNGLFRIALDGSQSVITRDVTSGGGFPIALDSSGNLYHPAIVPNTVGWSLVRRSLGGQVACIASRFRQIVGIAIDEQGNLFVADAETTVDEGILVRISPDGKHTVLVCHDDIRPHAITVGNDDCVYFSSIRGLNGDVCEIYKSSPEGHLTLVVDGLVQSPGLTFDRGTGTLYALDFLNWRRHI